MTTSRVHWLVILISNIVHLIHVIELFWLILPIHQRNLNIYNCTFHRCQAMKGAAMIDFKSVNGIIDKCYFKDCLTTDSTSGYISFNPPKI